MKKNRSLRATALLVAGICLGFFAIVNLAIYFSIIPQMIGETERQYVERERAAAQGHMLSAEQYACRIAYDIAIWDQTAAFAAGENPDFIEANWPDSSPTIAYGYDFLIIKNDANENVYVEIKDKDFPSGISDALAPASREVLARHMEEYVLREGDPREYGVSGVLFAEGKPYLVATMPIKESRASQTPAGTVTLMTELTEEYLKEIFYAPDAKVSVKPQSERTEADETSFAVTVDAIGGGAAVIEIDNPALRAAGDGSALSRMLILNTAALVLLCYILYTSYANKIIHPIERMVKEIAAFSKRGRLNADDYSKNAELLALCETINAMLDRQSESNVSVASMRSILSGIDANIYVTDTENDEVLFMNDRMRERYNLTDDAIGRPCWEVLQRGMTERCPFCPVTKLQRNPEEIIVWDEEDANTRRLYQNTDLLIEWTGGKPAHLQYNVDVTEKRANEANTRRRMEQQELMLSISQSIVDGKELPAIITDILSMTGEFLDASRIVLPKLSEDESVVAIKYGWHNKAKEAPPPLFEAYLNFNKTNAFYRAFVLDKRPYLICEDAERDARFANMKKLGVKSLMAAPLLISGKFWGMIVMEDCVAARSWSQSDVQLARMIANVVTGAIVRDETARNLVRMSSIVKSSPDFINYVSPNGKFEYANPASEQLFGYSIETIERSNISLLMDESTREAVMTKHLPKVLQDGTTNFEIPLRRRNGEVRLMEFSAFRVDTTPVGVGAIATDVTERKRLERDLVAAKEQAENSNRAKSDFLSRMSHEMRTPMGAIIGMTNIAQKADDPDKKEYCLDKIAEASKHLLGVINDILDMSKIEANKLELSYTRFNLEKMLSRVIDVAAYRATEKAQSLAVRIDPELPSSIYCDEQRLAQVIANYLSNAAKFTPEKGKITLDVRMIGRVGADASKGKGALASFGQDCLLPEVAEALFDETNRDAPKPDFLTLEITVTDTGIGITNEQQKKLFRSFEQADGGVARKFGGTGLGLAISKRIVDLMGGYVWVDSSEGRGAKFGLRIDVLPGEETADSPSAVRRGNLRALIVDDSSAVLEYFASLAEIVNLTCETAASGEAALEIIKARPADHFQLVFVDWQMPGMNGVEFTRLVKEKYCPQSVFIMISAAEWSLIEREARDAGVDMFLAKPLFASSILACIGECVSYLPPESREGGAEERTDAYPGKRILLAEDIDVNREIVSALLGDTGIEIDYAENGAMACALFEKDPARYDLIFMDIHMPEVDGYEAAARIRAMPAPQAASVPIIAMTANVFREDVERCLAAGMNDHVGKPIDVEMLFEKLNEYLG